MGFIDTAAFFRPRADGLAHVFAGKWITHVFPENTSLGPITHAGNSRAAAADAERDFPFDGTSLLRAFRGVLGSNIQRLLFRRVNTLHP